MTIIINNLIINNITNISAYFSKRIQGILRFKHLVEEIAIYTEPAHLWGNHHYRIYFDVDLKDSLSDESPENLSLINYFFSNASYVSGHKFISYPIVIQKNEINKKDTEIINLKTFYDSYLSLTTLVINLVESEQKSIRIKIQNIDNLTEFKLLNDFFHNSNLKELYSINTGTEYDTDRYQYNKLVELATKSNSDYEINPINYSISDDVLINGLMKNEIRWLLIQEQIPIRIETVNEGKKIFINAVELKNKLNFLNINQTESHYQRLNPLWLLQEVLNAEKKFKKENKNSISNQKKIQKSGINKGDLVYLKNEKIAIIQDITIEKNITLYKYNELTQQLQLKKRQGIGHTQLKEIIRFLPQKKYAEYKTKFEWKHIDLVRLIIKSKGMKPFK